MSDFTDETVIWSADDYCLPGVEGVFLTKIEGLNGYKLVIRGGAFEVAAMLLKKDIERLQKIKI